MPKAMHKALKKAAKKKKLTGSNRDAYIYGTMSKRKKKKKKSRY